MDKRRQWTCFNCGVALRHKRLETTKIYVNMATAACEARDEPLRSADRYVPPIPRIAETG